MNIFSHNDRYYHLQKFWTFLLNHPVQHRCNFIPILVAVEWMTLLMCSDQCSCPLCSAQSPLFTPWMAFLLFPCWRQKPHHQHHFTIFSFSCHPESLMYFLFQTFAVWILYTKMGQTECSKTLAYKIQTPGIYPEESMQHSLYPFSQQLCKEILWWVTILRYSQSDTLVLLHMFRPEAICVHLSSVLSFCILSHHHTWSLSFCHHKEANHWHNCHCHS
jgi:hypothetical protein